MRKKFIIVLLSAGVLVSSCGLNAVKPTDLAGAWIVNKATFNGNAIVMVPDKIQFFLPKYKNKPIIRFRMLDSIVVLGDMFADELPFKWLISHNKLSLTFDSAKYKSDILEPYDSLRTQILLTHNPALVKLYNFKRDSVLKERGIGTLKLPVAMYQGTYSMVKNNENLILTSPTTRFELVNFDYALKGPLTDLIPAQRRDSKK